MSVGDISLCLISKSYRGLKYWKCTTNSRDKLSSVNSTKSLFNDSSIGQMLSHLILFHCKGYALPESFLQNWNSPISFQVMSSFICVVIFHIQLWLLIRAEKWITLKHQCKERKKGLTWKDFLTRMFKDHILKHKVESTCDFWHISWIWITLNELFR